ncbi:MAG: DUF4403 family protein [Bacteroidales bacterium]|nr:DUF4403 family protein [Bacteroidales bacterium]
MKLNFRIKSNLFLTMLIVISSCKTIQVEKPQESYLNPVFKPEISTISIPINLNMLDIEKSVNRQFTGLIYEDKDLSDDNMQIKVWKSKNFEFKAENNQIKYTIPLKIWTKFGWKIERFGMSISDYYEATGELSISFSTGIMINQDWDIITTTKIVSHQWISRPTMRVAGVQVPITNIVDMALKSSSGLINNQIDKSISDVVNLKKIAEEAWNEIQKPMLMSEEHNTWLHIKPQQVVCTPISTIDNTLQFVIGFKGFMDCIIGQKPESSLNYALPKLSFENRLQKNFLINYNIDITNNFIVQTAKKELIGKTFEQEKKHIIVEDIDFFGNNGKIVFVLTFSGSSKGTVYFTGIPYYDKETKTLEIKDSDFDLNTKNALIKSANWLLHGTILKKIEPYLKFPIVNEMEALLKDVNNQIQNYEIDKDIYLKGKIEDIDIENIFVQAENLKLTGTIKGNANIHIHGF